MDKLISVIVPIYNVENYLVKCIESIINQTYSNLEIILVDDGSHDNCHIICDKYAKKDRRIKVIHKKNGGLSDARNAGLDIATGEYISFIDSDDYISLYFYEKLEKVMEISDSDIVECDVLKFEINDEIREFSNKDLEFDVFDNKDAMKSLILNNRLSTIACNKLYKKEITSGLKFKVGKTNEDDFYMYLAFDKANKIAKLEDKLYYYLQREDSIMGRHYGLNRLDEIEAKYERFKYIECNYKELNLLAKQDVIFSCLYSYQRLLKEGEKLDRKKGKKILNRYINNIMFTKEEYLCLNLKNKIWVTISKKSLEIACKIRNFFNIGF